MKVLGIIGGMGPMATVDLMRKIILATDAATDQEHIHILVDNNTQIPDRTRAIRGMGPSPVPELLESARRLKNGGRRSWRWPATRPTISCRSFCPGLGFR